jgi:ABC-type antimicrobial peptide transport system permease subunit
LAVGLIAAFRHFDSSRRAVVRRHPSRGADLLAALGAGLAAFGVLVVSVTGVDVAGSTAVRFVVVDITPATAMVILAAGVFALVVGRPVGRIASLRRTPIPDRTPGADRPWGRRGPVPRDPT